MIGQLAEKWAPWTLAVLEAPGNLRLLARLLTQMQRVVENLLSDFSIDVVETARENLVIGQA